MPNYCTELQTKNVPAYQHNQAVRIQEILAASKLVRKDDGRELWDTPHGPFWILAGEIKSLADELSEQDEHRYEENGIQGPKGGVVLDCGAHYGSYTRHALKLGAKLVVAIELAPDSIECLRKTFTDEIRTGRVILYTKGVWNKDDTLELQLSRLSAGNSVAMERERSKDGSGIKVPLTTIDKLVAELRLPRVDFIKMDIQGAEPMAVAGARETLRKFRPRLALSAYHAPNDPFDLIVEVRDQDPEYWVSFGPCHYFTDRYVPVVMFFR